MTEQGLLAQLRAVKNEDMNSSHMCSVAKWLVTLDAKERKEYEEIIDSQDYSAASIGRVLRKNKIKLTDFQIRYHRNRKTMKGCSCDTK